MNISTTLALILCLSLGATLAFSPEEQVTVDELLENREAIKVSVVNSLFGKNIGPKPKAGLTCTACRAALLLVLGWFHAGMPDEEIGANVKALCKTLDIVPVDVCDDVVDTYLPSLMFIAHEHPWLNRFDCCGMILGGGTDAECRTVNETMIDWDIEIPGGKPTVVDRPIVPEGTARTKVLHLTDIHPDLHYAEGSIAECGNYLCCRASLNDDPSNVSISAGPWGDYRDCDMPMSGVAAIFEHAATEHADAEFLMMTGDLTHHQIWNYTIEDNVAHYVAVAQAWRDKFGVEKPVYPVIGNHEPVPSNMFPPRSVWAVAPEYNMSWVYNTLADEFGYSLPTDALTKFRENGYYTLVHKPGFRIVALNTNFCYTLNFWLIHTPQDPEGQLAWLSETLDAAEKSNELVWIVGHVPPGSDDCWWFWGDKYTALINRYEAIIRAQFYGHTHNDDLRIFFDMTEDPPRPIGNLYISTSVTPYSYLNPGYKVFYADGERSEAEATWEIMDHEAYIYNVSEANLAGANQSPRIYKEYSAKEEFGMAGFRPVDLYDLVTRMALDDTLFQKFYKFWQMGYHMGEECITPECKLEHLCVIVRTDYSTLNCERLEAIMNGTIAAPN